MSIKVVNNIIFGKNFCRLCFGDVYDEDLRFHDEIILNLKTEKISEILTYLLGGKYTCNMGVSDSFCSNCVQSLKNSYNFMRMCKNNSDRLEKTITTLSEALQSTECSETSKSVLIQIDSTDYTFMQFYQYRRSVKISPSLVHGHSKYLIQTPLVKKFNPFAQVSNNAVITRHTGLDSDSKDKSDENTMMAVKLESSYMEHKTETPPKGSLEARHHRLKALIQQHWKNQKTHDKISKQIPQEETKEETKPVKKLTRKQQNKMLKLATKKLLSINTEKKEYVCDICKRSYNHRTSILYHIRNVHSRYRHYACKYCDDTFKCPSKLKYHIRKYHLELSAQCDICDAKFKQLKSIYSHRKRHFNPKSRIYVKDITD